MFEEYDEYIQKTAIVLNKHREKEVIKGIEWWFIELPKFRKKHKNLDRKIEQWLLFIDDEDKELVKMAENKNRTLQRARKEMNYLTGDAAVRRLAELREIWDIDYNSDINYARNEGKMEGRAEGIKEGKKEGKREGEKAKAIEIAKKLLESKMSIKELYYILSY